MYAQVKSLCLMQHSKSVVIEEEEEEADTHHIPDILPSLPPLHSLVKVNTTIFIACYEMYSCRCRKEQHHP